jgi:hypothetical protein
LVLPFSQVFHFHFFFFREKKKKNTSSGSEIAALVTAIDTTQPAVVTTPLATATATGTVPPTARGICQQELIMMVCTLLTF